MNGKPNKPTNTWTRGPATPIAVVIAAVALAPQAYAACDCDTSPCGLCVELGTKYTVRGSESYNCIEVETGAIVNINGTLTLTGPETSCVDGWVLLDTGSSVLAFTTHSHTVSGSGTIRGQNNSARIHIACGVTFTNDVKIVGRLRMTGSGDFTNDGSVSADDTNGTLDVQVTGTIDDEPGAGWKVTSPGAILRFLEEPACLQGDFTVTNGSLRAGDDAVDDIDVVTSGDLTHTGGKIRAGVDDSFTFNGTCP